MNWQKLKVKLAVKAARGFSLIEIMVVVTLMVIFIGLGTVYFMGQLEQGKINAATTQVHQLAQALDLFKLQTGNYPSTSEGLEVLAHPPKGQPLMQSIPKDPWGRDYNYANPGTHNPKGFDIWSDGPSGEGGESAIGNWSVDKGE